MSADNKEALEVLARLDERTKYIKETLNQHIAEPACRECELKDAVATLKTNVSWIKRIGIAIPAFGASIAAFWKGLQ